MCGSATLAIVLSTPCMIVASMIEAVISVRLEPALRLGSPLLTVRSRRRPPLFGGQRCRNRPTLRPPSADKQHHQRRPDTHQPGNHKGFEIGAETDPQHA